MSRKKINRQDTALKLVRLTRAVLVLIKNTPVENKKELEYMKTVAIELGSVLNDYAEQLDSNLGHNISEYSMFKFEDDGTDDTGWVKGYEEDTAVLLNHLEKVLAKPKA